MNLRPLNARVVIRRTEEETTTSGGIVLPGSATEKPSQGEVIAISGDESPVKVGDVVVFGDYAGNKVKVDGEELLLVSESDLLGVFEK